MAMAASWICFAVFARTGARLFKTRSTVATLTPAARAKCSIVGLVAIVAAFGCMRVGTS